MVLERKRISNGKKFLQKAKRKEWNYERRNLENYGKMVDSRKSKFLLIEKKEQKISSNLNKKIYN